MDRAPGLSARLKLTLSYAGFLMLAGVLMLAAVWVVVLRYIPNGVLYHMHPSWWFLFNRSDPLHGFGSATPLLFIQALGDRGAFLNDGVVGLGDWVLVLLQQTAKRVSQTSEVLG